MHQILFFQSQMWTPFMCALYMLERRPKAHTGCWIEMAREQYGIGCVSAHTQQYGISSVSAHEQYGISCVSAHEH